MACSKPEQEPVYEPQLAEAEPPAAESLRGLDGGQPDVSDPTIIALEHQMLAFEKEAARVAGSAYETSEESGMDFHQQSVTVFLSDVEVRMTTAGGLTQQQSGAAGIAVTYSVASICQKKVSDSACKLVRIKIKHGAGPRAVKRSYSRGMCRPVRQRRRRVGHPLPRKRSTAENLQ